MAVGPSWAICEIHEVTFACGAQFVLADLAGGGTGQRAELDVLGTFEMRQALAAPVDQLFGGGGVVGLEPDVGLGHLAPFLVGDRHDGDFGDGGVIGQRLLHFDRRDVLAARDDDVLHAVAQFDVAIGMDHGEVAGVEPAALKGLGGGLGIVVVAQHDVVAAHQYFAHGLAVGGDIVHVVVGHAQVHAGDQVGHALAGFQLARVRRRARRPSRASRRRWCADRRFR